MNQRSQFHLPATIRTGGAAKGVKVPPIETFTNNTPMVTYFSLVATGQDNKVSRSISAAGSVMKEPSIGTTASTTK